MSITDHEPERGIPQGYMDVLRLEFCDIDPSRLSMDVRQEVLAKGHYWMDKLQAQLLAKFVAKHLGRNILVHCAAGVSRSGAVDKRHFQFYEDKRWERMPNRHVESLLDEAIRHAFGLD